MAGLDRLAQLSDTDFIDVWDAAGLSTRSSNGSLLGWDEFRCGRWWRGRPCGRAGRA
ncbi:hypothetical protein J0H58_34815 [bacterium]|nr:hypothetical protein [bacterium]